MSNSNVSAINREASESFRVGTVLTNGVIRPFRGGWLTVSRRVKGLLLSGTGFDPMVPRVGEPLRPLGTFAPPALRNLSLS